MVLTEGKLRIAILGGAGEIGRNMMVLEYEENIIIIDAGIMFPENYMLGIDVVIPDLSYVVERKDRVRAIIVTPWPFGSHWRFTILAEGSEGPALRHTAD